MTYKMNYKILILVISIVIIITMASLNTNTNTNVYEGYKNKHKNVNQNVTENVPENVNQNVTDTLAQPEIDINYNTITEIITRSTNETNQFNKMQTQFTTLKNILGNSYVLKESDVVKQFLKQNESLSEYNVVNSSNFNFSGLNRLMKILLKEIINLTMIESNILFYLNTNNIIKPDFNTNVNVNQTPYFSRVYHNPQNINNADFNFMMSLGSFRPGTNTRMRDFYYAVSLNNFENAPQYFDTQFNNWASNTGFDNTDTSIGSVRSNINIQRNINISNLCLLSRLCKVINNTQVNNIDQTVYGQLDRFMSSLKN